MYEWKLESISQDFAKLARSDWQSIQSRRKFFDELAIKLNINNARELGKVTQKQICEYGGAGILNYYNGSVFDCFQSVYKGIVEFKYNKEIALLISNRNQMEARMVSSSSQIVLAVNRKS